MLLPISSAVLLDELQSSIRILESWEGKIKDPGIPGVDTPGGETALEEFLRSFTGELLIVAGKCENIANILASES